MILNEIEFYQHYEGVSSVIHAMQQKIVEAKRKNPATDFSDALAKVDVLLRAQTAFYKTFCELNIVDSRNFHISQQFVFMDEKVRKLQEENKRLREQMEAQAIVK